MEYYSNFQFCFSRKDFFQLLILNCYGNSLVVQQVKDVALSLEQPELLQWCGFSPWPRNFQMPWTWLKKKKKKKTVIYRNGLFYVLTRLG